MYLVWGAVQANMAGFGQQPPEGFCSFCSFNVHMLEKLTVLKPQVPGRLALCLLFTMYLAHAKWYHYCLLLVIHACFVLFL